jgi:hypothetical protein
MLTGTALPMVFKTILHSCYSPLWFTPYVMVLTNESVMPIGKLYGTYHSHCFAKPMFCSLTMMPTMIYFIHRNAYRYKFHSYSKPLLIWVNGVERSSRLNDNMD